MNPVLQINQLAVGYGKKTLCSDISFEINSGELIALIGRNGTGKTTLLKTLGGLMRPISGQVLLLNRDIQLMSARERAQQMSMVLTQRIALNGITVKTLVEMGLYPGSGRFSFFAFKNEYLVNAEMARMQITALSEKVLGEISDGELQKAMIARALVQKSRIILMDEPTAFLDTEAREELFSVLRAIVTKDKVSILFSSHDLEAVRKYSDGFVEIKNGVATVSRSFT